MKTFIALTIVLSLLFASLIANAEPKGQYPAGTEELTFNSYGKRLSGFIYMAAGKGPHPTVLLLHGYPGNEKNLDLAQALRKQGWNVVFFHYRGAWGSEGEFSFRNAEQDVQVVLQYLSDKANAEALRVDRNYISTVGHSMGGHMAIAGILDNPAVKCGVALDGANLGVKGVGLINDPDTTVPWKAYSNTLFMLKGWSGEKAEQEVKAFAKELDLVRRAKQINGRSVLLIDANTKVIPHDLHILPLYAALKEAGGNIIYKLLEDDHSFSSSRDEVISTTASFLNANCQAD